VILGIYIYKKQIEYRQASDNSYNMAFYELVDYVQNVEVYLAKSMISNSPESGAKSLSNVWREANLALTSLSQLPINSYELENTSKFLNQVSEYSYSLYTKNLKDKELTKEDMNNIKNLHEYSVELENVLNQLSADINNGRISFGELEKKGNSVFSKEVSNISKDSFSNLEQTFHEYSGLIYDGAFSEHITTKEKYGLTGDNIDEEKAKEKVIEYIGKDNIKEINSYGKNEGNIISYNFGIKYKDDSESTISISKKGGHIIYMDKNREVLSEVISEEEADNKAKEYLNSKGYTNMVETYYLKESGIVTINYAYEQENVLMYPDLIKVKVALDNGEILGIETTGYLNSHRERKLKEPKVSVEKARDSLNKNLNIESERLAIIPTEWKTEILCWEFEGNVEGLDFIVYVNAETGEEEDILIITNTPNGVLTH
jgi:spore germination protein